MANSAQLSVREIRVTIMQYEKGEIIEIYKKSLVKRPLYSQGG